MLASKALAFCFAPQLRVSDEYYISELVLTGIVTDSKDLIDPADPEGSLGTYYNIRVEDTYRGHHYRSLHVYSENSTARFPMKKGVQYVLFISKDSQKNWWVNNCGNSGEIALSSSVTEQLKQLPLKQSFIYGEVYSWQDPEKCNPMQLTVRSSHRVETTEVKANCTFEVDVPPGRYEAILRRNGIPVVPNDLNYKDTYCFIVPVGGSAGIAFRLADGADELNRNYLKKSDQHAKSLCPKSRAPQYLLF